ncbi:MAG: HAD family phosphatase [Clostridia bacterium]|nr:HAD family phosphatase [Clostridia bacterium]
MNALIENAKNIVFDVGQVLLRFEPKEFLPRMFPADIAQRLMPPALFGGDLWLRMDRGDFPAEECARLITEKEGQPELMPYELEFMLNFAKQMSLLPPAHLVPELKKMGKKLYIISNYGIETFAATQAQFPELFSQFDGMVISAREKLIKPDLRIYQLLCDRYGLKPEECVFIDDLHANVQGAIDAGFQGIHYTGPEAIA